MRGVVFLTGVTRARKVANALLTLLTCSLSSVIAAQSLPTADFSQTDNGIAVDLRVTIGGAPPQPIAFYDFRFDFDSSELEFVGVVERGLALGALADSEFAADLTVGGGLGGSDRLSVGELSYLAAPASPDPNFLFAVRFIAAPGAFGPESIVSVAGTAGAADGTSVTIQFAETQIPIVLPSQGPKERVPLFAGPATALVALAVVLIGWRRSGFPSRGRSRA